MSKSFLAYLEWEGVDEQGRQKDQLNKHKRRGNINNPICLKHGLCAWEKVWHVESGDRTWRRDWKNR